MRFHLPLLIPLPGLLLQAPLYDGLSPGVEEYGKVSRPTIDGKLIGLWLAPVRSFVIYRSRNLSLVQALSKQVTFLPQRNSFY